MWTRRFILFHGKRHPREMRSAQVEELLTKYPNGERDYYTDQLM
jgi:hypothetical protein